MRLLITGGAGCLGTSVVDRWEQRDAELLVIDNFATGNREFLPPGNRISIIEGSVSNRSLVDQVFKEFLPTHVIHAAASYKDPNDWRGDIETNLIGTINVAEASEDAQVERFINLQTALCYGRPNAIPIPIDHPLRPESSYAVSKTAAEQFLATRNLPWVSLRLANVTAPRLAIGPLPTFYSRLRGGQSCFCTDSVRDFLDVDDFLSLIDVLLQGRGPNGVFNVSTGEGHSIRELFDLVVDHLSLTIDRPVRVVPTAPDDIPVVVLDPAFTTRSFEWTPKVAFEDSVAKMLRWYDEHGVTAIYSHLRHRESDDVC